MDASKFAQLEAVLLGDPYRWAVQQGLVTPGEPLPMSALTITRQDLIDYLRTHPVPGLDIRQDAYQSITDGPKIFPQEVGYAIGWQERGIFTPEFIAPDEPSAREFWINFLAASRGLAA